MIKIAQENKRESGGYVWNRCGIRRGIDKYHRVSTACRGDSKLVGRILQFQPWFGPEERQALTDVIDSGWIGEHAKTRQFERAFVDLVGSKFGVATTSGGVAIYLALKSLGVKSGDEVVVPDYTMIATANAVRLAGATPVFADVRREDGLIDVSEVMKKITPRTRCIIPVHINGRACQMDALLDLAKHRSLYVVEDACQAIGSHLAGKHLGTFGDAGCFSFHPSKHMTTGQGGMVVTDNEETYEKLCRLKDYGRFERAKLVELPDYYDTFGFNFRFTDIQAALGLAQLAKLPFRLRRISEIYATYRKELDSSFLLDLRDQPGFVPWYADVLFGEPRINAKLKEKLSSQFGVETRLAYKPLHRQPLYGLSGEFPSADFFSERGLWLPSSTFLTNEEVAFVIDSFNKAVQGSH